MRTSMSPKPFFARWALSAASASAAVMSGTRRRSSFAVAFPGRIVTVGRDQSGERLDEVPCRAIEPRLVAGVHVLARTAAPEFTAGNQFALDHTFCSQGHGDFAIQPLRRARHKNSKTVFQRGK